ncbi:MAG: hypothetical protein J5833_07750, partial [Victivallales bacterium]|nr:hypothetical protein [Victivallales bacterium]
PAVRKAATGEFSLVEADDASKAALSGDTDGDGMPDWYEVAMGHDIATADADIDSDGDKLTNYFEYLAGTSPWLKKTDGKKVDREYTVEFSDAVDYKTAQDLKINPKSGIDTDDDGVTDQDEAGYGEAEETSAADNALSPAVERVLRISGEDSYLEIPNSAEYALTKNWTVDLWVKIAPELEGDAILVRRAIDTELNGDESDLLINYEVGLRKDGDEWRPYAMFSSPDGERVCLASATIAADVQTHIGASYDSDNNRLIIGINNSAMASVDCDGYALPDEFGLSFVRVGEGFLGEIDSVRIWSSTTDSFYNYKSASQDAAAGKVENGLVASFIFDDGGVTAQNFAAAKEDWKTGWVNAAALVGDAIEMTVVGEAQAPIEPVSEGEDSDEDGLPDEWEMNYFGNLDQGADDDPDEDGLTNLYEYWADTDPTVKKTDGINADGILDPDGDKVCNLDEQYYGTRPDMADTDDDGVSDGIELGYDDNEANYGYEVSSPLNSLEQPYMDLKGHVAEDEYGDALGIMSEASMSKIFRMVGDNWMTVKDNPAHSGRNMSFSFWIRANMLSGTSFDSDAELPATDTVFLRRSVIVDKSELSNYRFSISKKAIKFQFAQKATTERFTNVQFAPADGIKADTWYHVSAVAALDAASPYITVSVSSMDASTGKYVAVRTDKALSNTNFETMSGEEGTLTLGHSASNGLVLDVDDLNIWNFEKNVDDIDATYEAPVDENNDNAGEAGGNDDNANNDNNNNNNTAAVAAAADAEAGEETLEEGQFHSVFKFDDGGKSAEDFGFASDWKENWKHAGLLNVSSEQPSNNSVGRGMIHIGDTADSSASPSNPVIEIQTLTNVRNEETGLVEYCYRPLSNDAEKSEFDLLTAVILEESTDPEGTSIYYAYYWLKDERNADAFTFENGELLYNGQSVSKFLLSNVAKLDLYVSRADVAVGDKITLAVVAVNGNGKASEVQAQTVEVTSGQSFKIPSSLKYVSFTPSKPAAGSTLAVTVKTVDDDCDGYVVIEWFRNGVQYSAERQAVNGIQTVTFTQGGKDVTVDGDVWHFKAYFEGKAQTVNGVTKAAVKSRAIPPTVLPSDVDAVTKNADGDYVSGNYIYRLIGKAFDGDAPLDGTAIGNKPPTPPTSLSISPDIADASSILIATASGASDPNGDMISYRYQWYVDGEAIEGANLPYYPSDLTIYDADKDTVTVKAATALKGGNYVSVEVYAEDIYGSKSTSLFSEAAYIYDDLAELYGDNYTTYAYEPNDFKSQATRILPKSDWYDVDDANTQVHYFHKNTDVDWFWFVVPETLNNRKKVVKFETTASDADYMFDKMHLMKNDVAPDTQLSLFRQGSDRRILYCDDYGNTSTYGGTKFARFEMELEPGIYYVQVSLASEGYNAVTQANTWTTDTPYRVHLGISEKQGMAGPSAPASVTLSPDPANDADDLVCQAAGARSVDGSSNSITYYYVWYRNHELVPFGDSSTPNSWGTDRYVISQSKNYSNTGMGAPNVIPSKYTLNGQTWYCVVYAADSNGFSEGVMSNVVTVGESAWNFTLGVTKTYSKSSVGSVAFDDQKVTLGWIEGATFGYDPACDSALPTLMLPGSDIGVYRRLPQGRMYSIGLDNTKTALSADYRPYGRASSWFIKVEVGDDSLSDMTISWDSTVVVPDGSVEGLVLTRMSQSDDGTFLPVGGTSVSMNETESITFTAADLESMQTDEEGQKFIVFRVSLGAPDSLQMVTLEAGWNMVSFSITPLNNSVEEVFSDGAGTKYYRGAVYEYVNGQYVVAKSIVPTRGYWVFAPKTVTFSVYGNMETTSIKLNKGWNIAGPVYDIADFKTAYADYASVVNPDNIFEFISTSSGATSYAPIQDSGLYPMVAGKAYWIYAERDVELPLVMQGE